jgi:CTP synthase
MHIRQPKFVFITGGVVSSLGKGLLAASLGALLEDRGLKIAMLKLDPYINIDPGMMSPFQHGEVFVTDDGAETDLDLGHYERFTNVSLSRNCNYTTGRIYERVIERERQGYYQGATVQVIPHITDTIKEVIMKAAEDCDICIVEIGGTVGDIESLPFLEAIRQVRFDVGKHDTAYIHLTLVPYIKTAQELKTKPTQHSVRDLREIGIVPDILVCRCETLLSRAIKQKVALFANLSEDQVFSAVDVESIYTLPLALHEEGLDYKVVEILNIWSRSPQLTLWRNIADKIKRVDHHLNIAIVGKYVNLADAYKSLHEALTHAAMDLHVKIHVHYIDSEQLLENAQQQQSLLNIDGILVPGGFGERGIEGKIQAAHLARIHNKPYLGICLGMQVAVIAFARDALPMPEAHSQEFTSDQHNWVVTLMSEQQGCQHTGGSMRLGSYPCVLQTNTRAYTIYKKDCIHERHRHRFEINNMYRTKLEEAGLVFSGTSPNNSLVEMIEIPEHPFYIGCQFHPEFKSKPFSPHPLFVAFLQSCLQHKESL